MKTFIISILLTFNVVTLAQENHAVLIEEMIFEQQSSRYGELINFDTERSAGDFENLHSIKELKYTLDQISPKINRLIFEDGTVLIIKRRGGDMGGG